MFYTLEWVALAGKEILHVDKDLKGASQHTTNIAVLWEALEGSNLETLCPLGAVLTSPSNNNNKSAQIGWEPV